jgi:hypothetical protein
MKTTEEKNRMIAEFMGGEFEKMHFNGVEQEVVTLINCHQIKMSQLMSVYTSNLLFHTSWDWLMPVIEKIYSMDGVELDTRDIETVIDRPISIKLEDMHYVVCEFIEWYNTRKEEGQ